MKAVVSFPCTTPGCEAHIEERIDVSEPDFSAERMSDGDAIEDHDLGCAACDAEYTVETVSSFGGVTASLDGEDVDIMVEPEPDYDHYDQFLLDYSPTSGTMLAYRSARDELLGEAERRSASVDSALNRMIFSQMIAIMEAYLSDKLLYLVQNHAAVREKVIRAAGFLREHKVSMSEVLLNTELPERTLRLGLQGIVYHEFKRCEPIYNAAISGRMFPADGQVRSELEEAVLKRHHCIHRNGRNMDGELIPIDLVAIRSLSRRIDELVQHIEVTAKDAIIGPVKLA